MKFAVLMQQSAGGKKIRYAVCIKDQNSVRIRHGIFVCQCGECVCRYTALFCNQFGNDGVTDRFEGISTEGAFCYGNTVHYVNTVSGNASHLGEGGQKRKLFLIAGLQQGSQFCSDIAPESRIGFLVNIGDTGLLSLRSQLRHRIIGLLGSQMTGFRVDHKNLCLCGGEIHLRADDHTGTGAVSGKLYAGVQRTGKVIRDD